MRITISVTVDEDNIDETRTDLTEEAYDELCEILNDAGYTGVSVSRGF
jgi:DNA-binding MurR/RpiR family transcriptional regulator